MKLNVLMITYNQERFIAQALASILAQRVNFDYEIIVAEDNSTNGTRDIVLDLHHRYPGRIVPLFRDRNLGAMRNFKEEALVVCRRKYVALLEGDDCWTPEDKLQQINFLDEHPDHAICCHRAQFVDETGGGQSRIFPTSLQALTPSRTSLMGTIVQQENFEILVRLSQHTFDSLPEKARVVIIRDANANFRHGSATYELLTNCGRYNVSRFLNLGIRSEADSLL
jgi:glycosyltransferase involved in cell wall biosynthesis